MTSAAARITEGHRLTRAVRRDGVRERAGAGDRPAVERHDDVAPEDHAGFRRDVAASQPRSGGWAVALAALDERAVATGGHLRRRAAIPSDAVELTGARACQPGARRTVSRVVRRVSVLVACAVALALPAAAGAQETNAPPGNSGIDEYLETVPSASGDRPAGGGGAGRAGDDTRRLPAVVSGALRGRGADGRAVEDLVRSSPNHRGGHRGDAVTGRKPSGPVAEPRGDSPLSSVVRAVGGGDDSGGMGAALPAILLGALAALAAFVVVRLGRRGSAS